ncbi:hypothetical protein D5S17_21085 [Pseudonocardiaceae bacterium YIM PH 21723]|nr:hypothetical protein D5S17_21085 [Pseudonocardiaceae bacterium YIM PH 21723]
MLLLGTAVPAIGDPAGGTTVTLPSGVTLPPGRYPVKISSGGGIVEATVVVGGPVPTVGATGSAPPPVAGTPTATGTAVPAPAQPGGERSPGSWFIVIAVLAGVLLLGCCYIGYLRFVRPRPHIRQYRLAVDLIRQGQYAEALPILSRTEHDLPQKFRTQARFFAAFALVKLGSLEEAEYQLAALHREVSGDVDVAYLLAYVRFTRGDHDRAEPVLEAIEAAGGMDRKPARLLYGVVAFHRALDALRTGRVDAAVRLFQKVEQLGDFADRVPADLRNQHVVLGARALFDRDLVAARGQFEDLNRVAEEETDDDRRRSMLASADIGLALAAWLDTDSTSLEDVDGLLLGAAACLDPAADLKMEWTYSPDDDDVAERLQALAEREAGEVELHERDLALRSIHLLRAAAVLRLWAAADKRTGAGDRKQLAEVLGRLACALSYDPEFSDVHLIAGLLKCQLATTQQERDDGVALLRKAQKLGVREPDLLRILNQEAQRGRAKRDAADRYLQLLDQYIADPSVRREVRVSLLSRLSRFSKVRPLDQRPELARTRVVSPTVDDMNGRSELLRERVNQLIALRGGDELVAVANTLAHDLEYRSQVLGEQAQAVEATEADLLVHIGGLLLGEIEG